MHWIALQWPSEQGVAASRQTLAWWALRFTPHVVWADEALLLEVAHCERLWGGRHALLDLLSKTQPADRPPCCAQGKTSLLALAQLRLRMTGQALVMRVADLPLGTLGAARPHQAVLERLGCRTWGQADALPRAGLARRFGPELGRALDVALGRAPDAYAWIALPERFTQSLDLPHRADSAPALLWTARRLLAMLQQWLAARALGVLALELTWAFDQLRLNGRELPPTQSLVLRTAQATQSMAHLQHLLAERLDRTVMLAPARALRLRVLETAPWQPQTVGLLPEDQLHGDPLHIFVERVSARLGPDSVRVAVPGNDQRLECRQDWRPVEQVVLRRRETSRRAPADHTPIADPCWPAALGPTWLLRPPQPLEARSGTPYHDGQPLHMVSGPHRIESGWWAGAVTGLGTGPDGAPVARDYFVACDAAAQWLLIYRERVTACHALDRVGAARWFVQGIYA